jgi:glutamyl-tRNA reductase
VSELLALGISHKTAPVALRERLAFTEAAAVEFAGEAMQTAEVREAVAISTCNRTEVYLVVGEEVRAEADVLGLLASRAGIGPTRLAEAMYSPRNCDAARQLFRVTAGLESMIVGEAEIQGQVKRAYEAALAQGSTGALSNRLFSAALTTGKRVRSETGIGSSRVSVPSVAVDLAAGVLGTLADRHVTIIGAGETSELTARALADQGAGTIFVANRHADRALGLAQRFGGSVVGLEGLPEQLAQADIVVSSTSSPHAIVGAEELEQVLRRRAGRPLLLIDIAVPRDVDPRCGELPGVTLYDMDDLQEVVARNLTNRAGEVPRAQEIVEEEIHRFARWLGQQDTLPTVAALHEQAGRERRPLGVGERARSGARGGGRARGGQASAARADDSPAQPLGGAGAREPGAGARAVWAARGRDRGGPCTRAGTDGAGRDAARRGAPPAPPRVMRIGSRGSPLALAQARLVAEQLGGAEIVVIKTADGAASAEARLADTSPTLADTSPTPADTSPTDTGSAGTQTPGTVPSAAPPAGGAPLDKSRWVRTLEQALLADEIDLAVHSAKDLPGELPAGLALLGAPARAAPEDVLCGAESLEALPSSARIGTTSLRRAAQLRAAREDIEVVAVAGNVDTRLRKLTEGACDALVLARAGLQRLGCEREAGAVLDVARFVPAPGQGTLALEGRTGEEDVRKAVEAITDKDTLACLLAERAVARALEASCNTPLGAHAAPAGCGCIELRAWVGLPDGSAWVRDELVGGFYDPEELGRRAAERLLLAGAGELLKRAEEMAVARA